MINQVQTWLKWLTTNDGLRPHFLVDVYFLQFYSIGINKKRCLNFTGVKRPSHVILNLTEKKGLVENQNLVKMLIDVLVNGFESFY